ncbi:polyprenyl synthetase family protein [Candidatus Woesearchaeota archaeon]|nr:polyprenyl synthetase family protein [Candidatus Woesearchaeota archaeon]
MFKDYLESRKGYINRKIDSFLPEKISLEWLNENIGGNDYDEESISSMLLPAKELIKRGGKRWRPALMLLCCKAVNGGSKIQDLVPLVEIIHNGTLMIDDVEDNSDKRRGKESIHRIFGTDTAINTGNLMYYLPYIILKKIDVDKKLKLEMHEIIAEEMLKLHLGQGMDIFWHNNSRIPDEQAYLQMCAFKTGTLARMSAKLGASFGDAGKKQKDALGNFAESIGIAFQIQDDILNISGRLGKEYGDDISEGKKTLMVIKAAEKATPEDMKRLLDILSMKTKDPGLIQEAVDILNKYHTVQYARSRAKEIVRDAWRSLSPLIKESDSKKKLKMFADFLVEREI